MTLSVIEPAGLHESTKLTKQVPRYWISGARHTAFSKTYGESKCWCTEVKKQRPLNMNGDEEDIWHKPETRL